jgi:hypothetical protein
MMCLAFQVLLKSWLFRPTALNSDLARSAAAGARDALED